MGNLAFVRNVARRSAARCYRNRIKFLGSTGSIKRPKIYWISLRTKKCETVPTAPVREISYHTIHTVVSFRGGFKKKKTVYRRDTHRFGERIGSPAGRGIESATDDVIQWTDGEGGTPCQRVNGKNPPCLPRKNGIRRNAVVARFTHSSNTYRNTRRTEIRWTAVQMFQNESFRPLRRRMNTACVSRVPRLNPCRSPRFRTPLRADSASVCVYVMRRAGAAGGGGGNNDDPPSRAIALTTLAADQSASAVYRSLSAQCVRGPRHRFPVPFATLIRKPRHVF